MNSALKMIMTVLIIIAMLAVGIWAVVSSSEKTNTAVTKSEAELESASGALNTYYGKLSGNS